MELIGGRRLFQTGVLCFGFVCLILMILSAELSFCLFLFSLYSFVVVFFYNDKTFTNPVFVFTLFFYPYSTWYIFSIIQKGFVLNEFYLVKVLQCSQVGLLGFLSFSVFISLFIPEKKDRNEKNEIDNLLNDKLVFSFFYWPLFSIVFLTILYVVGSGFTSKREVLDAKITLVILSNFLLFVLTLLVCIRFKNNIIIKGGYAFLEKNVFLTLLLYLLYYFVVGERDYVVRYIFILLATYCYHTKKASMVNVSIVFLSVLFFVPLSQMFKSFVISGEGGTVNFKSLDFFSGEFAGSSRNLYIVLYYKVKLGYSYLLNDIIRGIVPFSSMLGVESLSSWYHNTFRFIHNFSGRSGWGFSLVAEGVVIDGYRGVFGVFFVISSILHLLHRRMHCSAYWFVFYLFALSTAIYCIRADLANFFSQTFKVSGLAVLCLWVFTLILVNPRFYDSKINSCDSST